MPNHQLHRNRTRRRNPVRNVLDTLLALRRYVGGLSDFGDLIEAHGDAKLRPVGDLLCGTMLYIDGELSALEDEFQEMYQVYKEHKARKAAARGTAA